MEEFDSESTALTLSCRAEQVGLTPAYSMIVRPEFETIDEFTAIILETPGAVLNLCLQKRELPPVLQESLAARQNQGPLPDFLPKLERYLIDEIGDVSHDTGDDDGFDVVRDFALAACLVQEADAMLHAMRFTNVSQDTIRILLRATRLPGRIGKAMTWKFSTGDLALLEQHVMPTDITDRKWGVLLHEEIINPDTNDEYSNDETYDQRLGILAHIALYAEHLEPRNASVARQILDTYANLFFAECEWGPACEHREYNPISWDPREYIHLMMRHPVTSDVFCILPELRKRLPGHFQKFVTCLDWVGFDGNYGRFSNRIPLYIRELNLMPILEDQRGVRTPEIATELNEPPQSFIGQMVDMLQHLVTQAAEQELRLQDKTAESGGSEQEL